MKLTATFVILTCMFNNTLYAQSSFDLQQLKEALEERSISFAASLDETRLLEAVHAQPEHWQAAFDFLLETDLKTKPDGRYDLLGKDCFATLSSYNPKKGAGIRLETHRKYTDIQMVVEGEEQIKQASLKGATVLTPYQEQRDIAFYASQTTHAHVAKEKTLFIFFPGDAHQPGLDSGKSDSVKKLVIKVRN